MWFEPLLLNNRLAWPDGRLVSVLEPVALERSLTLGPRGEGVDLEWEVGRPLQLTGVPGGVRFRWLDSKRERVVAPNDVWSDEGVGGPCFRVLESPNDSAGWPAPLAAPLGPWPDDMLGVIGDTLLEAGRVVGARLTARETKDDLRWLPVVPLLPPPCLSVKWRRGVVDVLLLRTAPPLTQVPEGPPRTMLTWALGRTVALLAICKPMRELQLRGTLVERHELLRFIAGLGAGGGLPCLERLSIELSAQRDTTRSIRAYENELRMLPGFATTLPTLQSLEVARTPFGH